MGAGLRARRFFRLDLGLGGVGPATGEADATGRAEGRSRSEVLAVAAPSRSDADVLSSEEDPLEEEALEADVDDISDPQKTRHRRSPEDVSSDRRGGGRRWTRLGGFAGPPRAFGGCAALRLGRSPPGVSPDPRASVSRAPRSRIALTGSPDLARQKAADSARDSLVQKGTLRPGIRHRAPRAMPSSAPPAAGADLDRIATEDAPGLGHNSGRVRGHRVPNLRWRAITIGSLRRHPRYRALPPESAVLLEAANPRDADDATLPFVRQHTPAWEAAREGRITTGTLALALGLWCSESAMGALDLPRAGRQSRDAQREVLDAAVAVRPVHTPNDRTAARARCLAETDAYAARLARDLGPADDHADETEGGWAVTSDTAVAAAASGARAVARELGREQEAAALLALLRACPNARLLEVGLLPLDVPLAEADEDRAPDDDDDATDDSTPSTSGRLGASPDGVLIFPLESDDPIEAKLAEAVLAGGRCGGGRSTSNSRGASSRARTKKKKKKKQQNAGKKKCSNLPADDDADGDRPGGPSTPAWGDPTPPGHAAVAVEVKVTSPFRWSTAGLKSFNNMAQYRVDEADADVPRDRVSPLHVPQLQLEAAAAECVGTLVVSYAPCGNKPGGAAMRLSYVPADEEYRRGVFSLLRNRWSGGALPGCFAAGGGDGGDETGGGERREAYAAFVRRTRRLAAAATSVADLAPIAAPPGTDPEPFAKTEYG